MRLALLTDSIENGSPGFAQYVKGLALELMDSPGVDATLIHSVPDPFYDGKPHECVPPGAGGVPLLRWFRSRQMALPAYLGREGFEVVHDTYHFGPFLRPSRFARVLTIGDLTPIITGTHRSKQRWAHRLVAPIIAHRAHGIVTFSDCSKRDIVRHFRVSPEKIGVAYLAASSAFRPRSETDIEAARSRLALPARYLLHVGTIEPRKNVERLVRAFARALPSMDVTSLLLVGRSGWRMEHLPELVRRHGLSERVIVRDDISHQDLPLVYNAAVGLVYPSLYEGFGLPPLEAMQCGAPVITSNTSSLPEVVGDAAITVAPDSLDAIAAAMVLLDSSQARRHQLREAGLRRSRLFSWRSCADATIRVYEQALAVARPVSEVPG